MNMKNFGINHAPDHKKKSLSSSQETTTRPQGIVIKAIISEIHFCHQKKTVTTIE